MSNTIISSKPLPLDVRAEKMQPYFGENLVMTDPFWHCVEVKEGVGSDPGHAKIIIPNAQGVFDAPAMSIVLNPDGPLSSIKHGTRCAINRRYSDTSGYYFNSRIWVGRVSDIRQSLRTDQIEVTASDARVDLKDVRVFGRFVYVPPNTVTGDAESYVYQQGWACHFNPGGRPNCIISPGGTPMFAPEPDFGLGKNVAPMRPEDQSHTAVCYWNWALIFSYLRAFYAFETPDDVHIQDLRNSALTTFAFIRRLPIEVIWPAGFGQSLDLIAQVNFNQGVGQNNSSAGGARKGRDINIDGYSLIGADGEKGVFDMMFDVAGGWSWYFTYEHYSSTDIRQVLTSIPTRWLSVAQSVDLAYAAGGLAKNVQNQLVITDGDFTESSRYTVTRAVVAGSLVKFETICDTRGSNYGNGIPGLIKAWSQADENAMCKLAVTLGGGTANANTFNMAALQFPMVFTSWVVNPAFDFQTSITYKGSSWPASIYDGFPRAKTARPVWPTLLSYLGNVHAAQDIFQLAIRPEIASTGDFDHMGPEADGLQVFDDGVIYIPGLRDIVIQTRGADQGSGSFRWNNGEFNITGGGALDITVNDIRMTLALYGDHRLLYYIRAKSDTNNDPSTVWDQLDDNSPDVNKLDASFSRTVYVDVNGLYEQWMKTNSAPFPIAAGGAIESPAIVRDDSTMIVNHAKRALLDRIALQFEGPLIYDGTLVTCVPPGTAVNNLIPVGAADANRKPYQMRRVVSHRRWISEKSTDERGRDIFHNKTEEYMF